MWVFNTGSLEQVGFNIGGIGHVGLNIGGKGHVGFDIGGIGHVDFDKGSIGQLGFTCRECFTWRSSHHDGKCNESQDLRCLPMSSALPLKNQWILYYISTLYADLADNILTYFFITLSQN